MVPGKCHIDILKNASEYNSCERRRDGASSLQCTRKPDKYRDHKVEAASSPTLVAACIGFPASKTSYTEIRVRIPSKLLEGGMAGGISPLFVAVSASSPFLQAPEELCGVYPSGDRCCRCPFHPFLCDSFFVSAGSLRFPLHRRFGGAPRAEIRHTLLGT